MNDLISRQQAIDVLHGYFDGMLETDTVCPADIYGLFECMPSVQPERPRGHWVETGDEPYDEWECDVCGFAIDGSGCIDPEEYRDVYKFCPNCGADMRGDKHETD